MARSRGLRSQLYRAARQLGNAQAAERGPSSYAKRVVRRKVYAKGNSGIRKLLKGFGL
jgi:hypothetical protein